MSLEHVRSALIDFSETPVPEPRSITPDEISVGELKAAARLIMQDIRETQRAVVITEESGKAIGILLSPDEFGRLRQADGEPGSSLGLGALRDRLAQRFPTRVRVEPDPGRGRRHAIPSRARARATA